MGNGLAGRWKCEQARDRHLERHGEAFENIDRGGNSAAPDRDHLGAADAAVGGETLLGKTELIDDGIRPLTPGAWKSVRATTRFAGLGEKVLTLTGHWDDRAAGFAQLDMGTGLFAAHWDRERGCEVMLDSMANRIEVVSLADAHAAVSAFALQLKKRPSSRHHGPVVSVMTDAGQGMQLARGT